MFRVLVRSTLLAAIAAVLLAVSTNAQTVGCPNCRGANSRCPSECRDYEYGRPDLFYNFYVPPTCGGIGAQMYVAPLPVPPVVGHTYYTYQPLMPHELLYRHYRSYHRYFNEGRGLTRTSVKWW